MPLKRASRGRTKGGKGSSGTVQCTNCGQTVPKDKAKKVTSKLNLVEFTKNRCFMPNFLRIQLYLLILV